MAKSQRQTSKDRPVGTRRKSRELALQMLFQADMGKQSPEQVRKSFWSERKEMDESVRGFADDIFRLATERSEDIDKIIEAHAQNWRMERMAAVDRNVIRAAVAEFMGYPQTPAPIVINEALEIARKFSSPEAVNFINGVLDGISKDLASKK
jgi:N utilization substance protein B